MKNVFTSELDYSPHSEESSQYAQPLPREIALPLTKGKRFYDKYDYVEFPAEPGEGGQGQRSSCRKLKGIHPQVCAVPHGGRDKEEHSGEGGHRLNNECGQQKTNHSMPRSQVNVFPSVQICFLPVKVM